MSSDLKLPTVIRQTLLEQPNTVGIYHLLKGFTAIFVDLQIVPSSSCHSVPTEHWRLHFIACGNIRAAADGVTPARSENDR